MVYLISGAKDSGKTTRLQEIYAALGKGDGFISKKAFRAGTFIGYDIVRLSLDERRPLARLADVACSTKAALPGTFFRFGRFCFFNPGLRYGERLIEALIGKKIEPLFIDEIGALELGGGGFADVFKNALAQSADIYLAVRNFFVDSVVDRFEIRDYRLL